MAFVCHFPRDADEFDQFSDELVNHTHTKKSFHSLYYYNIHVTVAKRLG